MRSIVAAIAIVLMSASGRAMPAPRVPVLVELFTSEGCSSCPPADQLLARLQSDQPVDSAEIVPIGLHVDYWDRLGWKDRFSSAALTNRQQVYGANFRLDSVYTPQMIVDGRTQLIGSDGKAVVKAIGEALRAPHAAVLLSVDAAGADIEVRVAVEQLPALGHADRAEVVVAVTEDRLTSNVTRGENRGRTLTHAAVVRSMTAIGQVAAGESSLRARVPIGADWNRDALKVVAFVQEQRGRAILGASAASLRSGRR
jgi:hypothetical protein